MNYEIIDCTNTYTFSGEKYAFSLNSDSDHSLVTIFKALPGNSIISPDPLIISNTKQVIIDYLEENGYINYETTIQIV